MGSLSMTYLEDFRFFQITRNRESYVLWILHETNEHFIAEKLSACPDEGGCLGVVSSVFPCCSSASVSITVNGDQAFHQGRLRSRSISPSETSKSTYRRDRDTLTQQYTQPVTTTESRPTDGAPDLPSENTRTEPQKQKKRVSELITNQRSRGKRRKPTTAKVASLLLTQLSAPVEKVLSDQNVLPYDADITNKLESSQQLVLSQPGKVDQIVEELQLWLQQVQQRSKLYLAALQHLLNCVDLYNWVNRCDKNTERLNNKERWSALQIARYRNLLANKLCQAKDGTTDCLGLTILAPMTAKGLKFGNIGKATEKDKLEIIQEFAALARPQLEAGLKGTRFIEVPNPVSFVCWFLEKPVEELPNIGEALCLTALSVEDCRPSPAIWHEIKMLPISEMLDDREVHSDEDAQDLNWLIKAGGQCDEITKNSYEMTVEATEPAQFDNNAWAFSNLLDDDALPLGFS
ncbi:uncharacterized protein FIESC28_10874 [Fusarium coffeatum]|uniref:Uncharacterized protein n=1 Tax=Fusarium coffeatum TaxID=231269 RepID=A0A366QQ09_9HYPO|nr:uncharacterized protein FIESC28_10874 [Fusarium coffeatum]RBR06953.1 hypothetical protein FIESC28_10874 [Fusarium coffeatum]